MSYRIEEKLSIDSNRIIDFKSFLANKTVKPIYQPRRIQSLYFENLNKTTLKKFHLMETEITILPTYWTMEQSFETPYIFTKYT